jgi:transcriptional regulator with XRE-family HTH domain
MLLDNVRMKNSTAIAQTLRHLMDRYDEGKGISENALSRATYDMFGEEDGVPQPTIHRILSGSSKDPKSRTILRLAEFFGVTDSQLRGYAPLPDQFAVGEGEGDYSASDLPVLTWEQADNAELVLEKIKQGMIKVSLKRLGAEGRMYSHLLFREMQCGAAVGTLSRRVLALSLIHRLMSVTTNS